MTDSTNTLQHEAAAARGSPVEVFGAFLKLGLTSFGGPVAHLGKDEMTRRLQDYLGAEQVIWLWNFADKLPKYQHELELSDDALAEIILRNQAKGVTWTTADLTVDRNFPVQ